VGGGTVHFTANYWRFREIDFIERSKWGPISGTGFADWPITYRDLEPYYTKAEEEIGVSGLAGASPFDPWRSKPYPMPPLPVKSSGVLFEKGARKLGYHPFPAPMAIASQPYGGRPGCVHCGFCEAFGCEVSAKSSTLVTVIPVAEKTGRCDIRPNSYVRQIRLDAHGRASGASYFNEKGDEEFQSARAVIVSANGAETARLLLMSKSNHFPNGLVGKYLMFDSFVSASGRFEHPLNEYKSVEVTRVMHDFYDADPQRGFYGGGGIDARFDFYPISFALGGLPPDVPTWGSGLKTALAEYFTHSMMLAARTTTLPVESNSVSLDPDVKDHWGLPALRVTTENHPDGLRTMKFFQHREAEILQAVGAQKIWRSPIVDNYLGYHLLGTCRMGNDPKTSVVNTDHRTHDVPNLFLCDSSSFVTSGRNQPTLTIQALAFRAADRIIHLAKTGTLGSWTSPAFPVTFAFQDASKLMVAGRQVGGTLMYVIMEYLTCLAFVSLLGLVLFGASVLGLVVKTGVSKLADETALKVPLVTSRLTSDGPPRFKKSKHESPVPSV
jgi:choline dehydrogenase-like flavoprotein